MRFAFRDLTVMTVHQPGSNNNCGRTPEMDHECAERTTANIVWLIDSFDEAKRLGNRGVAIFTQANVFPDLKVGDETSGATSPLMKGGCL